MECSICGNTEGNIIHHAQEMMFGTKDTFVYLECSNCNCLQNKTFIEDESKYYPKNYYSLSIDPVEKYKQPIKGWLSKLRDKYAIGDNNLLTKAIGKILYNISPEENLKSLSHLSKTKKNSFLDIGCGSGRLLYSLKNSGYHNLLGIDPYLDEDIAYENGLTIRKKSIDELSDKWDVVMMHHVFEHLHNPYNTLKSISKLLKKNGIFLLRIPIIPSMAWNKYGINWVQLDAPRHIYIHSLRSIQILIKDLPLTIENVIYDSMPFQFLGSEQYIKNIPLWAPNSYMVNRSKSIFKKNDFEHFNKLSQHANDNRVGDQVSIYLRFTGE